MPLSWAIFLLFKARQSGLSVQVGAELRCGYGVSSLEKDVVSGATCFFSELQTPALPLETIVHSTAEVVSTSEGLITVAFYKPEKEEKLSSATIAASAV